MTCFPVRFSLSYLAHKRINREFFNYLGFLSEDMTYSCAIFPELDGDLTGTKCEQNRLKQPLPSAEPPGRADVSPNPVVDDTKL
jgi:hypothetical protein